MTAHALVSYSPLLSVTLTASSLRAFFVLTSALAVLRGAGVQLAAAQDGARLQGVVLDESGGVLAAWRQQKDSISEADAPDRFEGVQKNRPPQVDAVVNSERSYQARFTP